MKDKIYAKWWFWVVVGIVVLGSVSILSDTDCPKTYKTEYEECRQDILEMSNAWENYKDALDNYCDLDPYNLICIVMR